MDDTMLFAAIFGGVWALVGLVFLCVGLGMRRIWNRREDRLRARTDGTVLEVIRHTSHSSNGSSTSWKPLVEFEYEGRRISMETEESVSRKKYYEGQRVEVLYDPDDPSAFRIEGDRSGRLFYRVFTAVGAVCLAIAAIAVFLCLVNNPMARFRWHILQRRWGLR